MEKYTDEYLRAYVLQQLAPEEVTAFEKVLAQDRALQKRTDEFRDLVMIAELSQQERTRTLLRKLKAEDEAPKGQGWWKGGIVLVFLVAGGWFALNNGFKGAVKDETSPDLPTENPQWAPEIERPSIISPEEKPSESQPPTTPVEENENPASDSNNAPRPVFAGLLTDAVVDAYAIPPSLEDNRNVAEKDTLNLAYTALTDGQANKAVALILPILKRDSDKNQARYCLANAYFLAENYYESAKQFQLLRNTPGNLDPDELDWYLLLAILARDKAESLESTALFEKILNPDAFHNKAMPAETLKQKLSDRRE